MELVDKLAILADAAKYDASCASSGAAGRTSSGRAGLGSTTGMGICHSYTPDGRCVSLLKILLTNVCVYDCEYCVNRRSSDVRRARFTPQEVVQLTLDFYRRNCIEGLFLSSGIVRSPDHTMEQLVEVARSLREDHDFRGYVHLKTIPEADERLIALAGRYADRLSVNLELPDDASLRRLAPEKDGRTIRVAMGRIRVQRDEAKEVRRPFAPAGQSTQIIVGADASTDARLLATASTLYASYRLRRVYYSAFSPIPHGSSRLPPSAPPLAREHRLYQADWMLRHYGYSLDEVVTATHDGNLDLAIDPKLAWALANREYFPVDVNAAPRERLLRVPGLGVRNVKRLLALRRRRRVRYEDLAKLRCDLTKARAFVVAADYRPAHAEASSAALRRAFAPARPSAVVNDAFAAWRERARDLLSRGVAPQDVHWSGAAQDAIDFGEPAGEAQAVASAVRIDRDLLTLLEDAACCRDDLRFAVMYRVLWRVARGERDLADDATDDDVARLRAMQRAVRRDVHKMTAFVRFRELREGDGEPRWIAWYEPDHLVVPRVAPFFVERFGTMHWTIATPDAIATWDRERLALLPPAPALRPPPFDAGYALWLAYYGAIFNPARLNERAMRRELPMRFWANLPEAQRIPALVAGANERAGRMTEATTSRKRAAPRSWTARCPPSSAVPTGLPSREALDACRHCPLGERATQAVPGRGPTNACLMLVGEQPGDEEDLRGEPFVGPAGRLLRDLLAEAGLDTANVYVTNAVKHFGFSPRGKRRIHKTPGQREVEACRGWLEAEIAAVAPRVIVALGRTALQALLGSARGVREARGDDTLRHARGARVLATFHPSALLRADDEDTREALRTALAQDLRRAAALADGSSD